MMTESFFESEGRRKIKWKKTEREKNSNDFEKDFKNLVPKDFLKNFLKVVVKLKCSDREKKKPFV